MTWWVAWHASLWVGSKCEFWFMGSWDHRFW
jgi:hypothetical protein